MKTENVINRMDNELVLEPNPELGIKTPGYISGYSVKDNKGNIRHNYEVMKSLSPETIKKMLEEKKEKALDMEDEEKEAKPKPKRRTSRKETKSEEKVNDEKDNDKDDKVEEKE